MTPAPQIICSRCGRAAAPLAWQCADCEGPLEIAALPPFDAALIDRDDFTLWRYAAMLPVERRFSLGEGLTPLVHTTLEGRGVYAKLEYLNPTGSYKDRGTTTMLNHMAGQGVQEVVEDSSGNAGASVAAYSSLAGVRARIFVPATAAAAKKALITSFGGQLVEVPGPQYAKTAACLEAARTTPYASHAWSPFFTLGQMTAAWEVWEQMGRRAPDAVVTPLGHGGLFLGFARGFRALHAAGLIERLPRLFGVQSAGCDPLVQAWEANSEQPLPVTPTHTVADGIIVDVPVRGEEVLAAARASGGALLRVDNPEILAGREALARRGLIVEATSAVTAAALPQVWAMLGPDARIVVALTGSGLKNLAG